MKVLVLGCGSIGRRHARNLVGLGVEVILYDPDAERAHMVAVETGGVVVPDRDAAEAEALVIATPSAHHVDDLTWGLHRGMHAFVEKPLACDRRQLDRARRLEAEKGSLVVMVGCNMRFTNGFRALRENLPRVGRVLGVQAMFGWYLPEWRPGQDYRTGYSARRAMGGGVILDAIHEIDYVMALAGPVSSTISRWTNTGSLDIDVEDLAEIVMTHQDGAISVTHLDYLQRVYTRCCRVVGTEANLSWDYAAQRVDLIGPAHHETILENADPDSNAMYIAEIRHFLEAVAGGTPTANDLAVAVATTEVAIRAVEDGGS